MTQPKINAVVLRDQPQTAGKPTDRAGGDQHGFSENIGKFVLREVPLDKVAEGIKENLSRLVPVLQQLEIPSDVEGWEIQEISLGLALQAEGSIGIATAGVQSSITLTLVKPSE